MHTEDLREILRVHPFLVDVSEQFLETLVGCASNVVFREGEYVMKEGDLAHQFFLIRTGRVALEMDMDERGSLRVQTVGEGEVLGWSWIISPFRWHFSGCAVTDVRAIAIDGECLRKKSESDPVFGYEILKRFSQVMQRRLEATQRQLMDVFGSSSGVLT
jgi:CRP-like cAMP-binding protein